MKKTISYILSVLLVIIFVTLCGCVSEDNKNSAELSVFAASSLVGVMDDMKPAFEAVHPGVTIIANIDGTASLETQLKEGAYADIFLPASTKNMENMKKAGLMQNESIIPYATNRMSIIVPVDNPANITTLADLAKPGIKIVSVTKDVPVRKYTEQILNNTAQDPEYGQAYVDAFRANVISEEVNAAAGVAKVALGEGDAAISYSTDVTDDVSDEVTIIEIPERINVVGLYEAGIMSESTQPKLAQEFITLLTSDTGKAILQDYGFTPV